MKKSMLVLDQKGVAQVIVICILMTVIGLALFCWGRWEGNFARHIPSWSVSNGRIDLVYYDSPYAGFYKYTYVVGDVLFEKTELQPLMGVLRFDPHDFSNIVSFQNNLIRQNMGDRLGRTPVTISARVYYDPDAPNVATVFPEYYASVNHEGKVFLGITLLTLSGLIIFAPRVLCWLRPELLEETPVVPVAPATPSIPVTPQQKALA
ncbi:MAG: hypothetical protein HQM09_16295 [Candidatus Riflebacteria bacterium]|nr:hypothetical protein [Candidatus Riflebacteria bacterium]